MITLIIRHRFIIAPVLLSTVIKPFDGLKNVAQLYRMVREYLPEDYDRLVKMGPADAAKKFIHLFSERYFPISLRNYEPTINDLTRGIPLDWHGFNIWNYEDFHRMSSGQLLAEIICEAPELQHQIGNRTPVIAEFIRTMGDEDLAKLLPPGGYKLDAVVEALRGSPWPGLIARCRWIFARTGNRWLDNDRLPIDWNREDVDDLSRQWPDCAETEKQMKDFDNWLKENLSKHISKVIRYIVDKAPKTLMEVLSEEAGERTTALTV